MKTALITGGTKGIGKAIALALLKRNFYTILNYSKDDVEAHKTHNELSILYPGKVELLKVDLGEMGSIEKIFRRFNDRKYKLNALVLNYGKTNRSNFNEISYNEWSDVVNSNLTIPLFLIQKLTQFIPKGGTITIIGSLMGIYPHSMSLSYGISKSASHALVENLVKHLSPLEIRINAIAPGFINTDWHNSKSTDLKTNIISKIALKRFGDPTEVSQLVSSVIENSYLNGQVIKIDGGYLFE